MISAYISLHKAYYMRCTAAGIDLVYCPCSTAPAANTDINDYVRTLGRLVNVDVIVTFGADTAPAVTEPAVTAGKPQYMLLTRCMLSCHSYAAFTCYAYAYLCEVF
jgi:hypothetical protein